MAMGDVIGRLSVVLGLDTAAFETGARRAAKTTNDAGDRMERLGARVGTASKALIGLGLAIGGSQLFGALKDLTMQGLEYASSLGEQAQQLGVLSSELQEYRYAASQAGIETAEMDMALSQLTKRIGQAAAGAKGPKAAFDELGISLRNAKGEMLTAGEAIPLIAEALSKIKDPAERARLEVELFGKSGQKLDALLTQGAAGVNNLRNAAHSLGIVLSEDEIQNADETADKLNSMKQVLSAQIGKFVAENAKEILALAQALLQLASASVKALNNWLDLRKGLDRRGRIIEQANDIIDKSNLSPQEKAASKRRVPVLLDKKAHKGDRVIGPAWLGLREGRPDYGQLTAGNGPMLNGTALSSFAPSDVNRSSIFDVQWGDQVRESLDKMRASMKGLNEETGDLSETSSKATQSMRDGWNDAAQGILSTLDRLTNAIRGGDFLDILTTVLGFGLQLGSMGAFGQGIKTKLNSPIPGFASGTSFAPGGLALVGERGPELVNLPRGAGVVPNHQLGRSMGGTRVEVVPSPYFDVRVQQNISQAAPGIARAGAQGGAELMFARQRRSVA